MNIALVSSDNLPGWEVDDKPLVKALEQKGAKVHCPSWTDAVDWNQFDISVVRTTWDYHSRKNEFVDWCRTVPRLYNNADIVEWNTHKSYLRELEQYGTTIAPTIWIHENENVDILQLVKQFDSLRGFIKPQVGACASDTLRFSMDELEDAQQFLRDNLHQDMMLQPYLQSVETEGELTAIFIDGEFTHGVQKIPVTGDYRVQDDFGASDMSYEFTQIELQTMQKTLLAVPEHEQLLYARFDYLRSDDGELLLNELELVEPSLFFRHCTESAEKFATAIIKRVS
jgi:hypothetical protein